VDRHFRQGGFAAPVFGKEGDLDGMRKRGGRPEQHDQSEGKARQAPEACSDKPNMPVAAAFYLLYVVGVLFLATLPGYDKGSISDAFLRGAVLGLLAYGTYDLTNLATLKGWAWQVSVIDMVWGTLLTGTVAAVGYLIARWLQV